MIGIPDKVLQNVSKPVRYIGSEFNAIHKDNYEGLYKIALAFPDVYEIGMSYLGFKILYELVNQREDSVAERVFVPWTDMEKNMREMDIPISSLESGMPVKDFDMLGFTLQHELSYTNILKVLDLAAIPFKSADRDEFSPLVIAGGPCAFNPEPIAAFFDFFVLGEGEDIFPRIIDLAITAQKNKYERGRLLENVSRENGIYIPAFFDVSYKKDGSIASILPVKSDGSDKIVKNVVNDLDSAVYPLHPIVPYMDIVHDRVVLELFRGCTRGCRFCQAGMLYRPVRERRMETLYAHADEMITSTGYDEIGLMSLSSSDYSCINGLCEHLLDKYSDQGVGVSLPSLRIDSFSVALAEKVQKVRKSGLTFAPEAGTQRLRDVINKNVTENDMFSCIEDSLAAGWTSFKLYFMMGLPTETDEDISGIVDFVKRLLNITAFVDGKKKRIQRVHVSVSNFVPKPFTPFQWYGLDARDILLHKQGILRDGFRGERRVALSLHNPEVSFLEAVFAKGDRRLAAVIEQAYSLGCCYDAWTDHFRFDAWMQAFKDCSVDAEEYAYAGSALDETLPWDHLGCGVSKDYLLDEREKALQLQQTPDCRFASCTGCGVCGSLKVKNRIVKKNV